MFRIPPFILKRIQKRLYKGLGMWHKKIAAKLNNFAAISYLKNKLLFEFTCCHLLLVNSLQHFASAPYRRFHVRLALPQLHKDLSFLKFFLILLECLIDVFAIF